MSTISHETVEARRTSYSDVKEKGKCLCRTLAEIPNHDQEGTEFQGDSGSSRMSNEEPNLEGWTLYETLQRVGDVFRPAVESRLIAFGRLGSPHANFSYFPLAVLGGQFSLNQTPAVDHVEAVCSGKDVFDLRFFPVLKPHQHVRPTST
jgi:hypothetical protein